MSGCQPLTAVSPHILLCVFIYQPLLGPWWGRGGVALSLLSWVMRLGHGVPVAQEQEQAWVGLVQGQQFRAECGAHPSVLTPMKTVS